MVDTLFYNGNIYSIDEANTKYEAIGAENGKIVFLGSNEEAAALEAAERIDLQGKTVLPGFIDSHLHMLNYAFVGTSYKMFDVRSIEEVIEDGKRIDAQLAGAGADLDQWIYGRGWNETFFAGEQRVLNRFDLDKISTERPILFIRVCGHIAAVNTKALEIVLGLENCKEYIEQIDVENGILTEASVKLCYNAMKEPSVEKLKEMILFAQKDINEAGITSVESDNFLSLPGRNSEWIMQAYRELDDEKKLTLRIREQASFTAYSDMKAFIDKGYRTGQGTDFYSIGPVKLYQDGSLGAKTALMHEPFEGTDTCGTMVHTAEDLQNCVDCAYEHDMQILIHSIGDRAADMVCDAYINAIEKYGKKENRLAINHLQIVSEDLFDRMKEHDILAYIQPVFVASDKGIIGKLVGEERAARSYMWKTMLDKGLACGGGSDSPVERFSVLEGIQVGVTRDCLHEETEGWHPDEKLTVLEAIRLFTAGNAYCAFQEAKKGTLELGKLADMTVLDQDIFQVRPHDIAKIKVLRTIVGGKEVYHAEV